MFEINENRLSNIESILEAALEFSRDAKIDFIYPCLDKETVVIESGHQPNFLPHAGLFKKIFLLHLCLKKASDKGKKSIAFFGFSDYNLCTAKLFTHNKFPAFNKLGYEKFGFKIKDKDIWKRFDCIAKPSRSEWESTIEKISSHYKKYPISPELNLADLIETLEDCYTKARNFPDLNAFFISRICSKLDIDVCFFRYSDIQRKGVFIEQWEEIISNLGRYNSIYNSSIEYHHLDMPSCTSDILPFWYHCQCGAKVQLLINQERAEGICRLCRTKHEIDLERLEGIFKDMSPNAVARNVIFSEGMGTRIFIAGTGGGLAYGKISEDISRDFGFNLPVTVSWKSRDYYMGHVHEAALTALTRSCGIKRDDILTEDLNRIIEIKGNELEKKAADARERGNRDEINKYEGEHRSLRGDVIINRAVFATTPSFADILVSQGIRKIKECWAQTLKESEREQVIIKDTVYDSEAFSIYKKIDKLVLSEKK